MIFHVCTHFGDIEVNQDGPGAARIRYFRLTPLERKALDAYLTSEGLELSGDEGDITVPKPVVEVGAAIGEHLHRNETLITAVRFETGEVKATTHPVIAWFKRLFSSSDPEPEVLPPPEESEAPEPEAPEPAKPDADEEVEPEIVDTGAEAAAARTPKLPPPKPPPPKPVAAVQTPRPRRGCPLPNVTELREAKAAAVVRKFLVGQQIADFDRHRAFVTTGCDTGRIYRVTSRWNPDVRKWGVLYDVTQDYRLCASNLDLPPSEEVLSMKFAVEVMEKEFLSVHD